MFSKGVTNIVPLFKQQAVYAFYLIKNCLKQDIFDCKKDGEMIKFF